MISANGWHDSAPVPPRRTQTYRTERDYQGMRGLTVILLNRAFIGTLSHYDRLRKLTYWHQTKEQPCPACKVMGTLPRWCGYIGAYDVLNKRIICAALTHGAVWNNQLLMGMSEGGTLRGVWMNAWKSNKSTRAPLHVRLTEPGSHQQSPDPLPEFPLPQHICTLFDAFPQDMLDEAERGDAS